MTFYEFAGNHPGLTIVLAAITASIIGGVLRTLFLIVNRGLRAGNIRSQGWPPSHCDADGDFKPQPSNNPEDL